MTSALLPDTQMAALPRVLYETLAHPRGTENTFARRMVLASRFRGSMLRLPLSGMVYREIATRTLDTASPVTRRGRREDRAVKKPTLSRPQNLAAPPSRFFGSDPVNFLDMKPNLGVVSSAQRGRTRYEFYLPLAFASL